MLEDQINKEVDRLSNLPNSPIKKPKKKIEGFIENYKEPLGHRLLNALFEGDPKTIVTSLVNEVAIPKTKDILADLFIGGIEKAIYGNDTEKRSYYSGYSSSNPVRRSSYDSYYEKNGKYYHAEPVSTSNPKIRWDRIVMRTRPQAMELLSCLRNDIIRYKAVSVSDLYDYITEADEDLGRMIDTSFPDSDYGWTNLDRVPVESVRDGFWIKFPKPERIN